MPFGTIAHIKWRVDVVDYLETRSSSSFEWLAHILNSMHAL